MTREHKLALIIGFTLVLVVGVLISDHFSKARSSRVPGDFADMQDSASRFGAGLDGLRPVGLVHTGVGGPMITSTASFEQPPGSVLPPVRDPMAVGAPTSIVMGKSEQEPLPPPVQFARDPSMAGGAGTPLMRPEVRPIPEGETGMPGRVQRPLPLGGGPGEGSGVPGPEGLVVPPTPKIEPARVEPPKEELHVGVPLRMFARHDVQEGESVYRIAKEKYGDGQLWTKLRDFNKGKIAENGSMREGVTLLLPPKEALLGKPLPPMAPEPAIDDARKTPPAKTAPAPSKADTKPSEKAIAAGDKPRTYVVQKGDVLSDVARKTLGSSKRWMEIHDLNKGMLDDENSLQVGMVLKLPAR